MRVSVLELPAAWGDPEGALARVDAALSAGSKVDLVLLPEASLTGYVSQRGDFDASRFAEPIDGPIARSLASMARAHGVCLVGPLVERDGARAFNAMVAFDASGALVAHYRKRHPWIPETWATRGDRPYPVFEVCGKRASIAICYDAHFLRYEAAQVLRSIDVLLFPSAWVEEEDSRPELLPALARDFGIAIVNANWGVGRPRVPGQGSSTIYGADGSVLATVDATGRADATV